MNIGDVIFALSTFTTIVMSLILAANEQATAGLLFVLVALFLTLRYRQLRQ
jgi:hypothetical protein